MFFLFFCPQKHIQKKRKQLQHPTKASDKSIQTHPQKPSKNMEFLWASGATAPASVSSFSILFKQDRLAILRNKSPEWSGSESCCFQLHQNLKKIHPSCFSQNQSSGTEKPKASENLKKTNKNRNTLIIYNNVSQNVKAFQVVPKENAQFGSFQVFKFFKKAWRRCAWSMPTLTRGSRRGGALMLPWRNEIQKTEIHQLNMRINF